MVRIVALAALTAAIAGSASAQEVRVSLVSKTPEQIQSDIHAAARSVCLRATSTESFRIQAYGRCVKDTEAATIAKMNGEEMAAVDGAKIAQR